MNREQRRRNGRPADGTDTVDAMFENFLDQVPEACPNCGVPKASFKTGEQYLPDSMTFALLCPRCDWSTSLTFHF